MVQEDLARRGWARVDGIEHIDDVNAHFSACRVYPEAHVPQTARRDGRPRVDRSVTGSECVCTELSDVVLAPYLLDRALALTDVAAAYLGRDPPLLYSANAFWTRPGTASTRPDIQELHCDADDDRFLVLFVYLTDVLDDADGPHEMVGPDGVARKVYGPAGTCFLADTRNRHRGLKPISRERGIAWARWGVSDPPASYVWDGNYAIDAARLGDRYPADPRLRESLRLLVIK